MIEFCLKEEDPPLVSLNEVESNQFFINDRERLCQKVSNECYTVIADSVGIPYSCAVHITADLSIVKKILPHVHKIKF